ncbi:hypothetical protein [Roseomonas sp. AR75]|uniref:hypothetical protein n=1 Tax=Roseomonas sp. AR75 TaxID=2562311 RepID=UPI0010BF7C83|nr:hypothetical protein [Roseomonas sp. AR75]
MQAVRITGGLRGAACVLALVLAAPARADCFDWTTPGIEIAEGALQGLPQGTVGWRIGRVPAGGGHLATAVELRWTAGGTARRQAIFTEMQDGTPGLSWDGRRVLLGVTYCGPRGCQQATMPYAWDPGAGRFAGASEAARRALAAACATDDD